MVRTLEFISKKRVELKFCPFFILFFFVLSIPNYAYFKFGPKSQEAHREILELKLPLAKKHISALLTEEKDNAIPLYLDNYADVISLFITEDKAAYTSLVSRSAKALARISKMKKDSPYYLFIQAEMRIHLAFLKVKFGDEVSAMLDIRQAYKQLVESSKKYPDFLPTKKSLGLMSVIIGSIPEKYQWMVNMAGMNGNVGKGVRMLEEVSKKNGIYQDEASILKVVVDNYILNREDIALQSIYSLYNRQNDNLLLSFLCANINMKSANDEAALKVLGERPYGDIYQEFPYLSLMHGDIFLHKGQYQQAKDKYIFFLQQNKGTSFVKDAYYKLFLCHWLRGEEDKANAYLNKVLYNGKAVYDADKYAQEMAEKRVLPQPAIMKGRLFTDGGYYKEALEMFGSVNTDSLSSIDKVELIYRTGRVYHKTGYINKAIENYKKTIEIAEKEGNYFAPNSALQLGYIYRQLNNRELAKTYFTKALGYKNYHYKNSIDNKARGALNELK